MASRAIHKKLAPDDPRRLWPVQDRKCICECLCGREFFAADGIDHWFYDVPRKGGKCGERVCVCSYTCMRRYSSSDTNKVYKHIVLMIDADGRIIQQFSSTLDAAMAAHMTQDTIRKACRATSKDPKSIKVNKRSWIYKDSWEEIYGGQADQGGH